MRPRELFLIVVFVNMLAVGCSSKPNDSKIELSKYLPKNDVDQVEVKFFKSQTLAKYPQYYWKLGVRSNEFETVLRAGFVAQDSDELAYVQKSLREDMGEVFTPDASDRLYGLERDRYDVRIIRRGDSECFVWVFRH